MESKAKLFGHPIHPMLIVFPLGLLATSVIFDLIAWFGGPQELFIASFWMIAAGVISGVVAAIPGTIDFLFAIPRQTRAWFIALWHGLGNLVVVALFALSWVLRTEFPSDPGSVAVLLSVVAVAIALVTGWLGGELVDRLGIGVAPGAHPDSPSSLSGRPASERAEPTPGIRRPTTVEP